LIQLPKLKKIDPNRVKKKKIFLITDDLRFNSGVGTVARELVLGTCKVYDWCQLAAALDHPDHGKRIDLSPEINKEIGISDAYCMQYCHTGYGNPQVINEIISYEKPDAILLITDPRFFGHVFLMEHELRSNLKIPLIYLNIWDNLPFPFWNGSAYSSMDLLLSINKQTKVANKEILKYREDRYVDIDHDDPEPNHVLLSYLPHGSSTKFYYRQTESSPDWKEYQNFSSDFKKKYDVDFIVFFNSRNVRRKQPGDVILAFKYFCDQLPPEKAKKCCLFMKTPIIDDNGTDLMSVKRSICPDYKVVFNSELLAPNILNWIYNMGDCVFFMSSAEGFGLAANEGLMCGTMLIAPVTGGLQDQMRFEDEMGSWIEFSEDFTTNHRGKYQKCGVWAIPIWPRARVLQGSVPTPYIFDDFSDAEDAGLKILECYNLGSEERSRRGQRGSEWVLGNESRMSSAKMSEKFISSVNALFNTWKPKEPYEFFLVQERKKIQNNGIQW